MRKYVSRFWNIVLPIGLTLCALLGVSVMIYFTEINKTPELKWLKWVGCIVSILSVIVYSGTHHMLDKLDEKEIAKQIK